MQRGHHGGHSGRGERGSTGRFVTADGVSVGRLPWTSWLCRKGGGNRRRRVATRS